MTTPNTSGGLQTADTGERDAVFYDAAQRTQNRARMSFWHAVAPVVAIGSTKSKIAIGGASLIFVDGVKGTTLTAEDKDILGAMTNREDLGNSEATKILIVASAGGVVSAIQGPVVASSETPTLPAVPASKVVLGDVTVQTESDETFVFGTTLLDAGDTDATYRDLTWPDSGPSALATAGGAQ